MTDSITLELPWPPSVNHYLRHTSIPISRQCPVCKQHKISVRTLISKDGRQWLKDADVAILQSGLRPMEGNLWVHLSLYPPNRRSIDIDNRQKPVLDALKRRPKDEKQTAWLFADDDSQVKDLHTEMCSIVPGGKCIVVITPIEEPQRTLGFDNHIDEE